MILDTNINMGVSININSNINSNTILIFVCIETSMPLCIHISIYSNVTKKMSNAERKIPSRNRIKSKMNNFRRSTSSKISNLSKKASNKFSKMKNTSRSSLKNIKQNLGSVFFANTFLILTFLCLPKHSPHNKFDSQLNELHSKYFKQSPKRQNPFSTGKLTRFRFHLF